MSQTHRFGERLDSIEKNLAKKTGDPSRRLATSRGPNHLGVAVTRRVSGESLFRLLEIQRERISLYLQKTCQNQASFE